MFCKKIVKPHVDKNAIAEKILPQNVLGIRIENIQKIRYLEEIAGFFDAHWDEVHWHVRDQFAGAFHGVHGYQDLHVHHRSWVVYLCAQQYYRLWIDQQGHSTKGFLCNSLYHHKWLAFFQWRGFRLSKARPTHTQNKQKNMQKYSRNQLSLIIGIVNIPGCENQRQWTLKEDRESRSCDV